VQVQVPVKYASPSLLDEDDVQELLDLDEDQADEWIGLPPQRRDWMKTEQEALLARIDRESKLPAGTKSKLRMLTKEIGRNIHSARTYVGQMMRTAMLRLPVNEAKRVADRMWRFTKLLVLHRYYVINWVMTTCRITLVDPGLEEMIERTLYPDRDVEIMTEEDYKKVRTAAMAAFEDYKRTSLHRVIPDEEWRAAQPEDWIINSDSKFLPDGMTKETDKITGKVVYKQDRSYRRFDNRPAISDVLLRSAKFLFINSIVRLLIQSTIARYVPGGMTLERLSYAIQDTVLRLIIRGLTIFTFTWNTVLAEFPDGLRNMWMGIEEWFLNLARSIVNRLEPSAWGHRPPPPPPPPTSQRNNARDYTNAMTNLLSMSGMTRADLETRADLMYILDRYTLEVADMPAYSVPLDDSFVGWLDGIKTWIMTSISNFFQADASPDELFAPVTIDLLSDSFIDTVNRFKSSQPHDNGTQMTVMDFLTYPHAEEDLKFAQTVLKRGLPTPPSKKQMDEGAARAKRRAARLFQPRMNYTQPFSTKPPEGLQFSPFNWTLPGPLSTQTVVPQIGL